MANCKICENHIFSKEALYLVIGRLINGGMTDTEYYNFHISCFGKKFIIRQPYDFGHYNGYKCSICKKKVDTMKVIYINDTKFKGIYHMGCFYKYWFGDEI